MRLTDEGRRIVAQAEKMFAEGMTIEAIEAELDLPPNGLKILFTLDRLHQQDPT